MNNDKFSHPIGNELMKFLSSLIIGTACLAAASATPLPRVAMLAFANMTGNDSYDTVSDAATKTLELTLRSLGSYEVVPVPLNALALADDSLRKLARSQDVDTVLAGSIKVTGEGSLQAAISIFDWEKNPTTVESSPVGPLDIFGAVDDLVGNALDSMAGSHIGFGAIAFRNDGEKGAYDVAIDGIEAGQDVELISRWKDGKHRVVISQKRMLGDQVLFDGEATVAEGDTATIAFSIPLLLDGERAKAEALERTIKANWDRREAAAETEKAMAEYAGLWRDTSYCPALASYATKAEKLRAEWDSRKVAMAIDAVKAVVKAEAKAEATAEAKAETRLDETSTAAKRIVDPHLLLWYKFDESKGDTVADSSGNGRDATVMGSAAWVAGKEGNALSLRSGYVMMPADLLPPLEGMTILAWLRADQVKLNAKLFDFGVGSNAYISLATNVSDQQSPASTYMQFQAKANAGQAQSVNRQGIDFQYWHCVAVTLAGGTATLFVDGDAVATKRGIAVKVGDFGGISKYFIGKSHVDKDPTLVGTIDDFRIYDEAFGPDEIKAHFSSRDMDQIAMTRLRLEKDALQSSLRSKSFFRFIGWTTSAVAVTGGIIGVYAYLHGQTAYADYASATTGSAEEASALASVQSYQALLTKGAIIGAAGLGVSIPSFIGSSGRGKIRDKAEVIDAEIARFRDEAQAAPQQP